MVSIGERYGRLLVVSPGETLAGNQKPGRRRQWICKCDCGNEKVAKEHNLRIGVTKSCGCIHREVSAKQGRETTTHGHTRNCSWSPEYKSWVAMISRCTHTTNKQYHRYGGRGISICQEWMVFENFLRDMGEKPTPKHTLDRIDNDGNYEPGNCRWATVQEQNRNRSSGVYFECFGERLSLTEWGEKTGIPIETIRSRIHKFGWSVEKALSTPPKSRRDSKCDTRCTELAKAYKR